MKIVFTSHTYEPYKDGIQAVSKYLIDGLVGKGHEVVLFTATHPDAPNEETVSGVRIIRMPLFRVHCINRGDREGYRRRILEETRDADALINASAETPWTDWCFGILDKIECRKILYLHGMYDFSWHKFDFSSLAVLGHKLWNQTIWTYYYATIRKYVSRYDAITHLHSEDLTQKMYCQRYHLKGTVIENAAESQFFQPIDHSITIDAPERYCILVANYISRKNQIFALRAFYKAQLPEDVAMIFIGAVETPYYNRLLAEERKLASRYGRRDVRFLTNVPREQTREYVKRATVHLLCSMWEAYPVCIVESMASGVPFISTPSGCVRYLPGGVIVENEHQMARWMQTLLTNPECARRLGSAGRDYAIHNQSVDVSVERLLQVIQNQHLSSK